MLSSVFLEAFWQDLWRIWVLGASAGKRDRWPNHINLLLSMVIPHGFISVRTYRSLLEIVRGHLTLMILLSSFLWNIYMLFSRVCVSVHSFELYMKILWMYVANTLMFTFLLTCLLLKIDSQVLYKLIVRPFRLLISSSGSSSNPRYLHFFQGSSPSLCMCYLSVFLSFTCKSSVSNIANISLSTWLIFNSSDLRNEILSAYFGSIVTLWISRSMIQSRADQRGLW